MVKLLKLCFTMHNISLTVCLGALARASVSPEVSYTYVHAWCRGAKQLVMTVSTSASVLNFAEI